MKLLFPLVMDPIEIREDMINVLVIENKRDFYAFSKDIYLQLNKMDRGIVLSEDGKILDMCKKVEYITCLVPFEFNRKTLITKLHAKLRDVAIGDYYFETCELLSSISTYLNTISESLLCDIEYDEIDVGQLLKASNTRLCDRDEDLPESLLEYCMNVVSLEGEKLFVFLGLNQFVDDVEYISFARSLIGHNLQVLMIESEYDRKRECDFVTIVDKDGCVI